MSIQIELYKRLQTPQFSQVQLVQAINKQQVQIDSVFSIELIRRCMRSNRLLDMHDTDLLFALGSFLGSER